MKFVGILLVVGLSHLGAGMAYADSDGYYCVGRGYLAYQFGFAAPPIGPHHLYVVRFGGTAGIEEPVALDLPQFQVQGIICVDRAVRILAYDAIYTVRLDATDRPVGYDIVPWSHHQTAPPEFVGQSLNLGGWSRAARDLKLQREAVGNVEGGGRYLLEITATAVPLDRCGSMVTTRLVRTDRNGREVQQVELFRGRGVRDCGTLPPNKRMWSPHGSGE